MNSRETRNAPPPWGDTVRLQTVTSRNRYGVTLSTDLYVPKQGNGRMAALAGSGPGEQIRSQAFDRYAHS